MEKKSDRNETDIKGHTREGKILNPPFLSKGFNMSTSSWYDKRLPEMLWAVLVIGNINRELALDYFRYIGKFVESNNDCSDVTITGISNFSDEKIEKFIKYMTDYSDEINKVLRPLLIFPELPLFDIWSKYLGSPIPEEDWATLGEGVGKTFWHQSQEATDCRWVKVLCMILGGKIKYPAGMIEQVRGILEYPNYGDMRSVRPNIRATEMMDISLINGENSNWFNYFWEYSLNNTQCLPEEALSDRIKNRQKDLSQEIEDYREHYFEKTKKIRNELINHFFENMKTSSVDSRYETSFGIAFYSLSLFIETIFYRTSLSITGRLNLRGLAETLITFKYLLEKEKSEPSIWDDFRIYGVGQTKLIYQKLEELGYDGSSMNLEELYNIANEDKWVEFIPINLGHWDSVNLRKMSEEVGLKEIYDKYYNYTSGFMHGNWGAVRESVYQKCLNPLHKYHRIPIYDLPLMPSILDDAIEIVNDIFDLLNLAYPDFKFLISKINK